MAINFIYNYPQVAREAGFKLRQYKDGPIDWRILGSIEIERLLQDQRFEQVDTLLPHLAEAPLGTILDTNILDSGVVKYFVVSQFAIQYLLFCRKFLDETIQELREAHAVSQMDVAKLRKSLTESNNEILQLHKKITQIEAIHEVVYPCHLCTKSFISNEALNIHITRRHAAHISNSAKNFGCGSANGGVSIAERRTDTPSSVNVKEREHNDLQLINAIKLELEIKQLKERLNNAERDIRERRAAPVTTSTTPREPQAKTLKNAAVQSELQETKEQDGIWDAIKSSEMHERKAQLNNLQAKIQEFETWRETQQANNQDSIAEINRKLNEIVQTLEETKALPTVATPVATVEPSGDQKLEGFNVNDMNALQRRGSPTVEGIERLLTEKVVEIGQKSAEKLEEFVHNMEANYKEKLEELEREIRKRNEQESISKAKETHREKTSKIPTDDINALPRVITYTAFNPSDSDSSLSARAQPEAAKRIPRLKRNITAEKEFVDIDKAKVNDETYILNENIGENDSTALKPKPRVRQIKNIASTTAADRKHLHGKQLGSQSTESNRTFVKAEKRVAINGYDDADTKDSTDISETFSSENDSDDSGSSKSESKGVPVEPEQHNRKQSEIKKSRAPIKPKVFTRNDAQKMLNKRLIGSGLDPKIDGISTAAMKHLTAELTEQRHALKQKYPNFYATRTKIKKLVDKLCSTKLPAPIEDILKHTKPIKPEATIDIPQHKRNAAQLSSDIDNFEGVEGTSTPIRIPQGLRESDDFKKRLERILASPIRRPNIDNIKTDHEKLANVPSQIDTKEAPVPLTRKRVMFTTLSPTPNEVGATNASPII
ncbi:cilium assembly protein DZIP1L isoform X2 [Eurosta solidaginis]|uniref:cilium assembly protein DZIP1L isoform X2 n=1 Tax=Eurosta solidaginis TaxID=178769 RepID=UPI003531227D